MLIDVCTTLSINILYVRSNSFVARLMYALLAHLVSSMHAIWRGRLNSFCFFIQNFRALLAFASSSARLLLSYALVPRLVHPWSYVFTFLLCNRSALTMYVSTPGDLHHIGKDSVSYYVVRNMIEHVYFDSNHLQFSIGAASLLNHFDLSYISP